MTPVIRMGGGKGGNIFSRYLFWAFDKGNTICPRSSYPFYIVAYYIKWVTTSGTYSFLSNVPIFYTNRVIVICNWLIIRNYNMAERSCLFFLVLMLSCLFLKYFLLLFDFCINLSKTKGFRPQNFFIAFYFILLHFNFLETVFE